MVAKPAVTEVANQYNWALVFSLIVHLTAYGAWEISQKLDIRIPLLDRITAAILPEPPPAITPDLQKKALVFVDVDPATASTSKPENTKFYAAQNTLAASPNPSTTKSTTPESKVGQTIIPRIVESVKPTVTPKPVAIKPSEPLQPSPSVIKPEPLQPTQTIAKLDPPKSVKPIANNPPAVTKPPTPPIKTALAVTKPESLSPPSLKEAIAALPRTLTAGETIRQPGGAPRLGKLAFDVAGSNFGEYDSKLVAAVQHQWYFLIEERRRAGGSVHQCTVAIEFKLKSDGRIDDATIVDGVTHEVEAFMCLRSITKPAPYGQWPEAMKEEAGGETRRIRFTFHYY